MPNYVNHSTVIEQADLEVVARASKLALDEYCRRWELRTWDVTADDESKYIQIVVVDEDRDVPDALAYHDTDNGRPIGVVMGGTIKDALRDDWFVGPEGIVTCATHELLEIRGDAWCSFGAQSPDGRLWWKEDCDPVQASSWPVTIDGDDVFVSNFVLKGWYSGVGPFDHLGLLHEPFSIGPGGYQVVRTVNPERVVNGRSVPAGPQNEVIGTPPPYHGWRSLKRAGFQ